MKHKPILLQIIMLAASSWLAAQHAVWWGGSPPPGNTAKDHSISYGNGFAWQVALGTAQSEDIAHDAIAVSSGGYLVVGANYYPNTTINNLLVLYRLTEEGDLVWEKGYAISDYRNLLEFSVIEKPDGGFLLVGFVDNGTNPRAGILIDTDSKGDTLSSVTWLKHPDGHLNDVRLIKSDYDESFFLSYRPSLSGLYNTKIYKLSYDLDTLAYTEIHNFPFPQYVPKPFGYIYRGSRYENISFHYLTNFEGAVLDSFPDPHGVYNPSTDTRYPMQSLRNGNNAFFRIVTTFPNVFKMGTTSDTGEVLNINPSCFTGDDIWWFSQAWSYTPEEFSDGSICTPFNFYFDYYDNEAIGLVKISSLGEHLGDTAITRSAGDMMLKKVLQGGDGRVLVFGTGKNGPLGGPTVGKDIFIAKIEEWNPVSAPTHKATSTLPLRVYPNPTNDTVVVTIPTGATKGTLSVVTLSGNIVHSQPVSANGEITLSAAKWPTGLLIVSLTTPDGVLTTKLVKN